MGSCREVIYGLACQIDLPDFVDLCHLSVLAIVWLVPVYFLGSHCTCFGRQLVEVVGRFPLEFCCFG